VKKMKYASVTLKNTAASPAACMAFALALAAGSQVQAADTATKGGEAAPITSSTTVTAPALTVVINKSTILRLEVPATRISVANPAVADITPINSREIYVLGKSIGSTNLIIWNKAGVATMMDVHVTAEPVSATPAPAPEEKDSVEVIKGLNKSKMEF
jgi:pilus assembly protein CpaC